MKRYLGYVQFFLISNNKFSFYGDFYHTTPPSQCKSQDKRHNHSITISREGEEARSVLAGFHAGFMFYPGRIGISRCWFLWRVENKRIRG